MSNNKYDIDRLIAYFEMAVKVMGYTNPEENSYEYHAAKMLKQLRDERDEARKLYCDNFSYDAPHLVARDMGWDIPEYRVTVTQYWCDDCGDAIEKGNEFFYAELPCDIASANKGESATVCRNCEKKIQEKYFNGETNDSE
jgi:hypothetical protein